MKNFEQAVDNIRAELNHPEHGFLLYDYKLTKQFLYQTVKAYFEDFQFCLTTNQWGNLELSIRVFDKAYMDSETFYRTAVLQSY